MKNKTTLYLQGTSISAIEARLNLKCSKVKASTVINRMINTYDLLIKETAPKLRVEDYQLVREISTTTPSEAFAADDAVDFLNISLRTCSAENKMKVNRFIDKLSTFSLLERKALMDIFLRSWVKNNETNRAKS